MSARAEYGRPRLPEPLRAQLVEALARLLVADVEHYPTLPAVDQVDTAPEGTAR